MQSNEFIAPEIIIQEILPQVDDVGYKNGITPGYYMSGVQQALEALHIDSFFKEETIDMKFDQTQLRHALPPGVFNIRKIYLWNGSCCSPGDSVPVHYKHNYDNHNGGAGYTANIKDGGGSASDPFYGNGVTMNTGWAGRNVPYAALQNGIIMFGSTCRGYSMVRLVVNSFGIDIGSVPIIPRILRRAITDWCLERALRTRMAKPDGARFSTLWKITESRLNDVRDGSWENAKVTMASMNTWQRSEYANYYSFGWKG